MGVQGGLLPGVRLEVTKIMGQCMMFRADNKRAMIVVTIALWCKVITMLVRLVELIHAVAGDEMPRRHLQQLRIRRLVAEAE
jgi:uncharacterized membrane protein